MAKIDKPGGIPGSPKDDPRFRRFRNQPIPGEKPQEPKKPEEPAQKPSEKKKPGEPGYNIDREA
jgi:hypothetical protein